MAIQLGLDGALRLADRKRESIEEALRLTVGRYDSLIRTIKHEPTPRVVYWRIVFAILSVYTAFEPNTEAYKRLRMYHVRYGRMPGQQKLANLLAGVKVEGRVIQFPGQKARYLLGFDKEWREDRSRFMPGKDGSKGLERRLRTIKGLARTKASFATCLILPLESKVLCLDRHMSKLLIGGNGERQLRVGEYDKAESTLIRLARRFGVAPFAVQWCLWDAQRGRREEHSCLAIS